MQRFIVLILGILFTYQIASAQQAQSTEKKITEWTQRYKLDQEQQKVVKHLVEMKYTNAIELERIKASEPELYEKKSKNLDLQVAMGIKSILNETQLNIYRQEIEQKRAAIRQRITDLKAKEAEKTEIAKAVEELKALN